MAISWAMLLDYLKDSSIYVFIIVYRLFSPTDKLDSADKTVGCHLTAPKYLIRNSDLKARRISSSTAIFDKSARAPRILLLREKKVSIWPGQGPVNEGKWETPGGGVNVLGFETISHAGEREAFEETGLKVAFDEYVGRYEFHIPQVPWLRTQLKIMSIVSIVETEGEKREVTLSHEHSAYVWATEEQVEAMPTEASQTEPVFEGKADPTDEQWSIMSLMSADCKGLILRAFETQNNQKENGEEDEGGGATGRLSVDVVFK
ncbi:hypothetical protein MMC10_011318 [Thelotrema lepadinum]|nr:hypothetical protein [Thelotrema lepadinum]